MKMRIGKCIVVFVDADYNMKEKELLKEILDFAVADWDMQGVVDEEMKGFLSDDAVNLFCEIYNLKNDK